MICQSVEEAMKAFESAKAEGLRGLYPSAVIVLAQEVLRLRSALETIAFPRHGTPEERWGIEKIGEFASLSLTSAAQPGMNTTWLTDGRS